MNGIHEVKIEDRKKKEAEFHDLREKLRKEGQQDYEEITTNTKFYSVARGSDGYLYNWLKEKCANRKVLDYCCGRGGSSLKAASYGGYVTGIDISSESIATCVQLAAEAGVSERTQFMVMDAENLDFEDNTFDVIICSGVLHHLDIHNAYRELSRVLRPGGAIICVEALGYNPLINWYRRRTPHLRTEWEIDHILTLNEVKLGKKYFDKVEVSFFHFATLAAVPFRRMKGFTALLSVLEGIDKLVLKIPYVQRMAWQMIFVLSKSK